MLSETIYDNFKHCVAKHYNNLHLPMLFEYLNHQRRWAIMITFALSFNMHSNIIARNSSNISNKGQFDEPYWTENKISSKIYVFSLSFFTW